MDEWEGKAWILCVFLHCIAAEPAPMICLERKAVIAARGSNANAVDCNVLLEEVQRQLGPGECPLVSTGMLKKVLRNVAGAPTSAAENPEGKEAAAEVLVIPCDISCWTATEHIR